MRTRSDSIEPGSRFGRLLVVEEDEPYRWSGRLLRRRWRCLCDCGREATVRADHLVIGDTVSCGCFRREFTRDQHVVHGHRASERATPEYELWRDLRSRYPGQYPKSWDRKDGDGFRAFLADVGSRPSVNHRLLRVDPLKRWSGRNCRWAVHRRVVTLNGKKMTLKEAAATMGIAYPLLCRRLQRGWSLQRALKPAS